jgi:tetratricopeptide (TPR) repeat protein
MDVVQFGRWLSKRRRAYGWQSQRALVEAAREHPLLSESGISEDFLARLEAGHLVHPFRGSVRRRVLALTWLLCKTPRDVRSYLRAAELTELSTEEAQQQDRLNEHLASLHTHHAPSSPMPLLLPPRPTRLVGRDSALHELLNALRMPGANFCAVTGMPGIGKSALAYEAVHLLASNERERQHLFPAGIATLSGRGRNGIPGLISLLNEIVRVFSPSVASASRISHTSYTTDSDLATLLDSTRAVLANKPVLLLIDDLDANFPLGQALEVLLAGGSNRIRNQRNAQNVRGNSEIASERRVVLVTSCHLPPPVLLDCHLHLGPLEPGAALDLLTDLIGRPLIEAERHYAEQICATVGYLPLAVEAAANTVITGGIPLSLLSASLTRHPLNRLLDGEHELHSRLAQALQALSPQMQERFALLSTLGAQSFGLESAASISTTNTQVRVTETTEALSLPGRSVTLSRNEVNDSAPFNAVTLPLPPGQLANTAADLGQFMRHSLLELAPAGDPLAPLVDTRNQSIILANDARNASMVPTSDATTFPRYWFHPLLHAYALEHLDRLDPEVRNGAQRNIQSYALAYVERYQSDVYHLECEREFLLAALAQAWQREQYAQVVRLVMGLLPLTGRLGSSEEGERLLLWGVHASRQLRDRYSTARFLNRLGGLLCHRGELTHARQVWEESLQIAESLGGPAHLWQPLANLAHLAHIVGDIAAARRFAEIYLQHVQKADDPGVLATALSKHGFYARLLGDWDTAYDDLSLCVRLVASNKPASPYSHQRFCEIEAELELARAQGDYERSQEHTEMAISLLQQICDRYYIADLLFDQACFAHQQGLREATRLLASRTIDVATQIGADHFRTRSLQLLQQVEHRP